MGCNTLMCFGVKCDVDGSTEMQLDYLPNSVKFYAQTYRVFFSKSKTPTTPVSSKQSREEIYTSFSRQTYFWREQQLAVCRRISHTAGISFLRVVWGVGMFACVCPYCQNRSAHILSSTEGGGDLPAVGHDTEKLEFERAVTRNGTHVS